MELDCLASAPLLDDEGTLPFETGPDDVVDCDCGDVGADAVFVATCCELPLLPVDDDVVPGGVVA